MMSAQIQHNFKYHPPTGDVAEMHAAVRLKLMQVATFIEAHLPDTAAREKALAITKLEEAMMWACAGIARHPAPAKKSREFQQAEIVREEAR